MNNITESMLADIKRREYNNKLARAILGINEEYSYKPAQTNWTKYKGSLAVKTDEGYSYV